MNIPEKVKALFERTALIAFGTATKNGNPNINVVFWKKIVAADKIILLDNFFKTTKKNLAENKQVCLSIWDPKTEEGYKLKGVADYFTSGHKFELGKEFIQIKNPGREPKGVVEIKIMEIFILTPGKEAGKKLASS